MRGGESPVAQILDKLVNSRLAQLLGGSAVQPQANSAPAETTPGAYIESGMLVDETLQVPANSTENPDGPAQTPTALASDVASEGDKHDDNAPEALSAQTPTAPAEPPVPGSRKALTPHLEAQIGAFNASIARLGSFALATQDGTTRQLALKLWCNTATPAAIRRKAGALVAAQGNLPEPEDGFRLNF